MKTEPIALTIFGSERCVVMLADHETAAKAVSEKAVREREMSAQPSTFGAEIYGQIRPINAESAPSETETLRP